MDTWLSKLTGFLLELLYFGIDWLYNAMIDILNAIVLILTTFIMGVVALFPPNPCSSLIASCSDATANLEQPASEMLSLAVTTLNWLIPVQFLFTLISCAMMSVMIYFTIAPLARWLKLIT